MRRLWYRLTYRRVQVDIDFGEPGWVEGHYMMPDGIYSNLTGLRTFMSVRRWEWMNPKNYMYGDQFRVAGGKWEPRSYQATAIRGRFNRLAGLYVRVPVPDGVQVRHEVFYVADQAVTSDE